MHIVLACRSCSNSIAVGNDNPLTAFWTSYLNMAENTLGLLRAVRQGDWLLHLASIRAIIIPWCFVYDKVNCARFLSYYYATMSCLPIDHLEVHQQFMQCGFSVQLGSQNPFGRITVDQTIEETVNRGARTVGGANGFSLNRAAVERYYFTSEYRSVYLRQLRKWMDVARVTSVIHTCTCLESLLVGMKLTSSPL